MHAVENNKKPFIGSVALTLLASSWCYLPTVNAGIAVVAEQDIVSENASNEGSGERRRIRPGATAVSEAEVVELADPNRKSGLQRIPALKGLYPETFIPVPDRWRIADAIGIKEGFLDPYNRNLIKSDRPIFDDWFANVSVISDTIGEYRLIPTPNGNQTTASAGDIDVFGSQDQYLFNQNLIVAFVFFKGDTVFRPPDFEFRITPVFNYNYTDVEERRFLNIDPREGTDREDGHIAIQELFVDYHINNSSDRYDFNSIRVGIQPFSLDFRGFLFQDIQLGARLFGTWDNNLWQYNLAAIWRHEKDTNSGLNDISEDLRDDQVFFGNIFRQDFPVRGFTSQLTFAYNRNREANNSFFDDNGFLVRPASIGNEIGRDYDAYYAGFNGDGHFGRVNLTVSGYYLFGDETTGLYNVDESEIDAYFFAGELSMDFDWIRVRLSGLYASGDDDAFDNKSNGYDAIVENPQFAGADSSFWIRQAVPFIGGGGVALSGRNGILNSLESSKDQGQSNFTNPGIVLIGLGTDMDILPEFRLSTNFNKLYFDETNVLEVARNQGSISSDIGWDLSVSAIYRPKFSQNIVFRLSGAALVPGDALKDLYGNKTLYSVLGNLILTY